MLTFKLYGVYIYRYGREMEFVLGFGSLWDLCVYLLKITVLWDKVRCEEREGAVSWYKVVLLKLLKIWKLYADNPLLR